MQVHRTRIATLAMAATLMVASCDGQAPSEYPLEPHALVFEWCPGESWLAWTLDFGLASYEAGDSEPLEWPGGYFYAMFGPGGGAGGGGGTARCGCSDGARACGIDPAQQTATRWQLSGSHELDLIPTTFEVRVDAQPGHRPARFTPDTPVLDLRFDLGPPGKIGPDGCASLPVTAVTEAAVSESPGLD